MPDRAAPVVVAATTSRTEAELIVGLLHSYGLHAAVSADDAGGQALGTAGVEVSQRREDRLGERREPLHDVEQHWLPRP